MAIAQGGYDLLNGGGSYADGFGQRPDRYAGFTLGNTGRAVDPGLQQMFMNEGAQLNRGPDPAALLGYQKAYMNGAGVRTVPHSRALALQDYLRDQAMQQHGQLSREQLANHLQGIQMQGANQLAVAGLKDPDRDAKFVEAMFLSGRADEIPAALKVKAASQAAGKADRAALGVGPGPGHPAAGAAAADPAAALADATAEMQAMPSPEAYQAVLKRVYDDKSGFRSIDDLAAALAGNDKFLKNPAAMKSLVAKMQDLGLPAGDFQKDLHLEIVRNALEGSNHGIFGGYHTQGDLKVGGHTIRPFQQQYRVLGVPAGVRTGYQVIPPGSETGPMYTGKGVRTFHDLLPTADEAEKGVRTKKAEALSAFDAARRQLLAR